MLLFSTVGYCQSISNLKTALEGNKVTITYDLAHANAQDKFKFTVYSSHDNYAAPIEAITGDLDNVPAGTNHRLVWDAKSTLTSSFEGEVKVKLVGIKIVVAPPKFALNGLDKSAYKRGSELSLGWTGGRPTDKISIALYKGEQLVEPLAEKIDNNQTFTWAIPKGFKTGSDYTLRVTDDKQATNNNTPAFKIKTRVPFIVKVLPFLVVGIIVAVLPKGGGGGTTPTPEAKNLPDLTIKPN